MSQSNWPLDANQVIQSVYDLDQNALRVNTQATVAAGALEVAIDATTDSIQIGDGTDFLAVNPDGSINVITSLNQATDSILIYGWDGSANQKIRVDSSGHLLIDGSGFTQPVSGTVTANQGTSPWLTSRSWTLSSGTDSISSIQGTSPWVTNVSQWGGTSTTLGQKAMTASIPVVIASDQSAVTVAQATAANLNAQVVGNIASAATDSGNPIKTGAKYNTTLPTITNGQRVDSQANAFGELAARPRNKYLNIVGNATTTVKSGAGVLGTLVINNGANATTVTIYDNTTATGTKIATVAVLGINTNVMSNIKYDVEFSTGLTIVTAGSAANDITVTYQ